MALPTKNEKYDFLLKTLFTKKTLKLSRVV